MKFVLNANPSRAQIDQAVQCIVNLGITPFICPDGRTILGICEKPRDIAVDALRGIQGLESVAVMEPPYPLASRELQVQDTAVEVKGIMDKLRRLAEFHGLTIDVGPQGSAATRGVAGVRWSGVRSQLAGARSRKEYLARGEPVEVAQNWKPDLTVRGAPTPPRRI